MHEGRPVRRPAPIFTAGFVLRRPTPIFTAGFVLCCMTRVWQVLVQLRRVEPGLRGVRDVRRPAAVLQGQRQ